MLPPERSRPGSSKPASPFSFYGLMLLSAACVLLGTLPVLASFGLVRGSEPSGPLVGVVVFLFGAVFLAMGAGAAFVALSPIARAAGATDFATARGLAWKALRRRADVGTVSGAAGIALLAAACWLTLAGVSVPLLADQEGVMEVFTLEFLLIHGFVFFAFAAGFAHERAGRARVFGVVALVALTTMYGVIAWHSAGGVHGVAWLLYLLAPNVLAFARDPRGRSVRLLAISRWAVKFYLFVVLAAMLGEGGDVSDPAALPVAAAYFTMLTVMELWRVPEIPIDLEAVWRTERVRPS